MTTIRHIDRTRFLGVILALCGLAGHALAAEGKAATGRLLLSTNQWDFGHKWVGIPTTTEISLKNIGNTNLTIADVITSCGCAAAAPKDGGTWKGRVLAPGAQEQMVIAFNTARPAKDVSRTITVQTDDPAEPRSVITIKGQVQNPFESKPEDKISFGRLTASTSQTKEIELVNVTGKPMRPKLRPPAADSAFDIKLAEIQPGKVYKLSATTRPPLNDGYSSLEVQLETGVAASPLQNIAVTAFVAAPVFVAPTKLFADATKQQQRMVRVSYEAGRSIQIKEVRSTHPNLIKAQLLPPRNAITNAAQEFLDHTLMVTLPPGSELPANGALIEIHTNDPSPEYKKFTIPIESLKDPARGPAPAGQVRTEPKSPGRS